MSFANRKNPITITDKALDRIKYLLDGKGQEVIGIRIIIKQKGCFGLKYNIEYAYEIRPFESTIEVMHSGEKVKILIDPKAIMFILGSEMDFVEDKFSSGFVFKNPNEKGRCGCGESFYV
ncbi:iron-sulfur cluster assembly accessory protein [Candidatus Mesenet endosymbiont of Phosphuga atrata]|uniref:HesB/IscA family protein n=1 Tax=Candidatus Mesenet endosymbiont of Phosphuga atrata TaxID=3066221 RepID=UPI0030CA8235